MPTPPNSIQSRISAAAVALLAGTSFPAYRCRMAPFTHEQLPAFNVIPVDSEADYGSAYSGSVDWKFRWKMRCTADAADAVDAAVDPLFVAGSEAILADPTLGGLCLITRFVGSKWEREGQGEYDQCALVVTFESEFATAQNDPSSIRA
jgi:hypothetical protein